MNNFRLRFNVTTLIRTCRFDTRTATNREPFFQHKENLEETSCLLIVWSVCLI